jgi:hypothetical protein
VVPAEEVEQPVSEEHRQLWTERTPSGQGLAARGGDADDDVAEERPGMLAMIPLTKGEGEDIGRAILPPINPVQFLYLIVACEDDGDLAVRKL